MYAMVMIAFAVLTPRYCLPYNIPDSFNVNIIPGTFTPK